MIVAEEIAPQVRGGDADGAIRAVVDGIVSALGGAGRAEPGGPENVPWSVVIPASHYFYASLPHQFDELIWFDETAAVTPLAPARSGDLPETNPFGL
jgi:hypothetical protein